jgi:hypothetical protein
MHGQQPREVLGVLCDPISESIDITFLDRWPRVEYRRAGFQRKRTLGHNVNIEEARQSYPRRERFAFGVVALVLCIWHFTPLLICLHTDLPPYAFGHESIGVRFGEAWRSLTDSRDYFHVPGGHLLDLINRGILLGLLFVGARPEVDFLQALKMFSQTGLFLHASAMSVLTFYAAATASLTRLTKLAVLVGGGTLGYGYFWAPNRLFYPDYHLTLNVLAYALLVLGALRLEKGDAPGLLMSALLVAGFIADKLSLVPWVLILLALASSSLPALGDRIRRSAQVTGRAGLLALGLAFLWVNGHVDLLGHFAYDTARFLVTAKGVEPAYHGLSDFVASGTVYRPLLWVTGAWMLVAALSLVAGRRRDIPLLTLLGGGLYVLMLSRRPGDTMVYEIVAFLAVSGILSTLCLDGRTRSAAVLLWASVLVLQAAHVGFTAIPAFIDGARLSATVAAEIDAEVKASRLETIYSVRDEQGLYQSAATAAFKATFTCGYARRCSPQRRDAMIRSLVTPYRFVLPDESWNEPVGPFLVLYVDHRGEEPGRQLLSPARQHVNGTTQCRTWQQHSHTVHVCRVAGG